MAKKGDLKQIKSGAYLRFLRDNGLYECCGAVWRNGEACLGRFCPVELERQRRMKEHDQHSRRGSVKTEEQIAHAGLMKAAAQAKAECDLLGKPYTPQLQALLSYLTSEPTLFCSHCEERVSGTCPRIDEHGDRPSACALND
jgi:hypothetical protein